MKPLERDELLIRMDERLKAIKDGDEGAIPEILKHLAELNDHTNSNTTTGKVNRILASTALMIALGAIGLSKIVGLW